jgi:acetyl-CoA C-acetyltransferase
MCPIDDFKLDPKSEYQWWCLSLGHPVGSTGSRIILTLFMRLNVLVVKKVAALCIGGGEATAVAIEFFN